MEKGAELSSCKKYRYKLWRIWDEAKPKVLFVMLNPSTADAEIDDPTIRRCINFAKNWGFGGIYVCNLFAYRATNPRILKLVGDPIGQNNDQYLLKTKNACESVVFAWGNGGRLYGRHAAVYNLLSPGKCLGITRSGQPLHPLYVKSETVLCDF